jgi:Right handed beta helix region
MVAGDIVYIRGGFYHETITPSHSGTSNAPITYAVYSNEVVTIDAADAVTGWTVYSNSIYQAPVGWDLGMGFNQVFVDGIMTHQAQYPNYGSNDVMHPATVAVAITNANTNIITSAAWLGKPANYWAGAWFSGGVGLSWGWQTAQVASSTGATVTMDPTTETPNWWFTGTGQGYLWGTLSLLDGDNEWHLQTNSGGSNTLYLQITGGTNPASHTVEMKHRNWCVDLNGMNYITLSGLNLWAGAVRLNGTGSMLENCQAQYLSHFMIITESYNENGGVEPGGGVVIEGNNNVVGGCTIANTAGSGIYSTGNSNLITRNTISNTDYSGTYGCCIALHGTGDVVTFNTAHDTGRDVLRPEGAGSDIRFNDLYRPGLLCKDLGPVYVWGTDAQAANGTDTRIAYNWIHDSQSTNTTLTMGVYLDNYDANFIIDHNVCWNTGGDAGIRVNAPAVGHLIYNNTLFNCANVGANTFDSWPGSNPDPAFWTNDVDQYSSSNNLYLGNSPQTQLVNWTNEDFRLLSNAPAIDAGSVIPGFTDGYVGAAPDLGAYEYGALPWKAGVGAQPTLTVASGNSGTVVLKGSPEAAYCRLMTSPVLGPGAVWSPAGNALAITNFPWSVTLPVQAGSTQFYRLQSP